MVSRAKAVPKLLGHPSGLSNLLCVSFFIFKQYVQSI